MRVDEQKKFIMIIATVAVVSNAVRSILKFHRFSFHQFIGIIPAKIGKV